MALPCARSIRVGRWAGVEGSVGASPGGVLPHRWPAAHSVPLLDLLGHADGGDGASEVLPMGRRGPPGPSPVCVPLLLWWFHLALPSALCSQVSQLHRPPGLGQGPQAETFETSQVQVICTYLATTFFQCLFFQI